MRAIIKCTAASHVGQDELQKVLDALDWLPRIPQDDSYITGKQAEIFHNVAEDDRSLVEKTFLLTIYNEDTKTWGIVNNPTSHVFTFRLKNPVADRLKAAAEKLVQDLSTTSVGKHRVDGGEFKFVDQIVVLEPNSDHSAYTGEVLPAKGFMLAVRERKRESYVGAFTVFLTILLLVITSPPFSRWLFVSFSQPWQDWLTGNLNRFTTAASVTATIAWFEVILYFFEVRRQSTIRWILD